MWKCLSSFVSMLALAAPALCADAYPDPAPPRSSAIKSQSAAAPKPFDGLTFHAKPRPLPADAKTSDWLRVLGPSDDATSPETHLRHDFPESGPAKVWEMKKGEGYTSPA